MVLGLLPLLSVSSTHRLLMCLPNPSLCTQRNKQAPPYLQNRSSTPQACGTE